MALQVTRRKIGIGQNTMISSYQLSTYSRIEVSQFESFLIHSEEYDTLKMSHKTASDISLIFVFFYIDVEIVIFSE